MNEPIDRLRIVPRTYTYSSGQHLQQDYQGDRGGQKYFGGRDKRKMRTFVVRVTFRRKQRIAYQSSCCLQNETASDVGGRRGTLAEK